MRMQELGNLDKGGQELMEFMKRTILVASTAAFLLAVAAVPQMAQTPTAGGGAPAQTGKGGGPAAQPQVGQAAAVPNRRVPPLAQQPGAGSVAGGARVIPPIGTGISGTSDGATGNLPQATSQPGGTPVSVPNPSILGRGVPRPGTTSSVANARSPRIPRTRPFRSQVVRTSRH